MSGTKCSFGILEKKLQLEVLLQAAFQKMKVERTIVECAAEERWEGYDYSRG